MNHFFQKVSNEQERAFEKDHIRSQEREYLKTDVIEKISRDDGYRSKVEYIESKIRGVRGWILDLGSNTCGESEFLVTKGYSMVAGDINEYALDLSRQRCKTFRRKSPFYCAFDAECLPISSGSFACVIIYESLHHVEHPERVLSEVNRVLKPTGRLFLYEPYAYNPYRRLSEIRDKCRGTIERSFSEQDLLNLLAHSNFRIESLDRHVEKVSAYKLKKLPPFRQGLRVLYHKVSHAFPRIFGSISIVASKAKSS